jgi:hypothetical protein
MIGLEMANCDDISGNAMEKLNSCFTFRTRKFTGSKLLLFTSLGKLLISLGEGDKTLLADHNSRAKKGITCFTQVSSRQISPTLLFVERLKRS